MSHGTSTTGRRFVECDHVIDGARCGRRTFGRRDAEPGDELHLFDLPNGWAVAPYPDDFDHGQKWLDFQTGEATPRTTALTGILGDLHTCPSCATRRVLAHA